MKITKTQLQNIIREEIDALAEDDQIDELFGFGKKAKRRKANQARIAASKKEFADMAADADGTAAQARIDAKDQERSSGSRERNLAFGGDSTPASLRDKNIARDRKYKEDELQRRKSMERDRAAGRNKTDYARKTDRYGTNNRKDESKVHQQIREVVAKAVKAHLNK
tara:strand:+ start:74 stop:574 length:501 start_codon:yes stop_codon:yes gene_type:complete